MKTKHCSWCDTNFETEISYQIYCSPSCRDYATKDKIAVRYQIYRRKKRVGQTRVCKSCQSNLSIYNDENLCQRCLVDPKDVQKMLNKIKGLSRGKNDSNK